MAEDSSTQGNKASISAKLHSWGFWNRWIEKGSLRVDWHVSFFFGRKTSMFNCLNPLKIEPDLSQCGFFLKSEEIKWDFGYNLDSHG
jgi:hypothetical protein